MILQRFKQIEDFKILAISYILLVSLIFYNNLNLPLTSANSKWSQTTHSDFINGTLDNLTVNDTGFNSNLKIDLSEFNEWQEVSP